MLVFKRTDPLGVRDTDLITPQLHSPLYLLIVEREGRVELLVSFSLSRRSPSPEAKPQRCELVPAGREPRNALRRWFRMLVFKRTDPLGVRDLRHIVVL